MAAVTEVPGLSALLAWPTEHLTRAADHWDTVGERNYEVAHQVWRDALSVDWRGETADTLRTATHADMQTTSATVDQLQAAASAARSGASDLDAARARVQYAVQDARTAGFEVGEDLSVTDRMTGSLMQQAARQSAAQAFAADIGQRAAQLISLDAQVADNVTAAMAGVANAFPRNLASVSPPTDNGVRAVDNHTFKQDPPQPIPVDPKDMTADQARAAWAEVNAEIKGWNARCGVENVGPLPPAQYSACVASRGPLLERQAAIRARLGQLGIPVEGQGPAPPATSEPPLISKLPLQTDRAQIESKYKHAADFGIGDPRGRTGFDNFDRAVKQVVDDPATLHISGTFRGQPAILNYNPDSGLCVVQTPEGKFISGWKLDPEQAANVTSKGTLGGGN